MKYVESPESWAPTIGERSVFLAGGITGCPDWQAEMVCLLSDTGLTLLNPRRKCFSTGDPTVAWGQIAWEHEHLRKADAILFWFCAETLQPIVLFELGAWLSSEKAIRIGVAPGYARAQDVTIQTALVRPELVVVHTLQELAEAVKECPKHGRRGCAMPKFRKLPVTVEAEQITEPMEIETLEGVHHGSPGDWLITGVKGEKYFCKPDIFALTYEPVGSRGSLDGAEGDG